MSSEPTTAKADHDAVPSSDVLKNDMPGVAMPQDAVPMDTVNKMALTDDVAPKEATLGGPCTEVAPTGMQFSCLLKSEGCNWNSPRGDKEKEAQFYVQLNVDACPYNQRVRRGTQDCQAERRRKQNLPEAEAAKHNKKTAKTEAHKHSKQQQSAEQRQTEKTELARQQKARSRLWSKLEAKMKEVNQKQEDQE